MRLALFMMACIPVCGQVHILATPEPMAVVESLGLKTVGLWSISVCNETVAAITLPRERFILALPTVRIISNERARAALEYARGRTNKARAASLLRYALMGATAATALARTNPNVVAGLAVGAGVATEIARRLESELPALAPWVSGLSDESLVLGPGQCGSRTVFAALQHGAKSIEVVIR